MTSTADMHAWWAKSAEMVLQALGVDPEDGLPEARVAEMRARYGANTMVDTAPTGWWDLLWESVTSPMMLLLLAVAVISLVMGQVREAMVEEACPDAGQEIFILEGQFTDSLTWARDWRVVEGALHIRTARDELLVFAPN